MQQELPSIGTVTQRGTSEGREKESETANWEMHFQLLHIILNF